MHIILLPLVHSFGASPFDLAGIIDAKSIDDSCGCRCKFVAPLKSHVFSAFSWDIQWGLALNRSRDSRSGHRRWDNYAVRVFGRPLAPECNPTPHPLHLHVFHCCHLPYIQFSLLIARCTIPVRSLAL